MFRYKSKKIFFGVGGWRFFGIANREKRFVLNNISIEVSNLDELPFQTSMSYRVLMSYCRCIKAAINGFAGC